MSSGLNSANGAMGGVLPRSDEGSSPEARLRALVLLGGSVRPSALSRALNRSMLDLPVDSEVSVLGRWIDEASSLATCLGREQLLTRVIIDKAAIAPKAVSSPALSIERDPAEYRGTGGLLRDLASNYGPDDLLLVANGAQITLEPLAELAKVLLSGDEDVRLVVHEDGEPSGLMLVRCAVLAHLNPIGFVDFKEQFLPRLAGLGYRVGLVVRPEATGIPIRTLDGYIDALRRFHRKRKGLQAEHDAFAERWESTFSIVEGGAMVDPSATLQDVVVLKGASVQRRAAAVRSVLCDGAVLAADGTLVDEVLTTRRTGGGFS
jgi:hypothetical protein